MNKKEIKQIVKRAVSENKKLAEFLIDNKAYGRYVKNCVKQLVDNEYENDVTQILSICERNISENASPICGMFKYMYTSEDHQYWNNLNYKYITECGLNVKEDKKILINHLLSGIKKEYRISYNK